MCERVWISYIYFNLLVSVQSCKCNVTRTAVIFLSSMFLLEFRYIMLANERWEALYTHRAKMASLRIQHWIEQWSQMSCYVLRYILTTNLITFLKMFSLYGLYSVFYYTVLCTAVQYTVFYLPLSSPAPIVFKSLLSISSWTFQNLCLAIIIYICILLMVTIWTY